MDDRPDAGSCALLAKPVVFENAFHLRCLQSYIMASPLVGVSSLALAWLGVGAATQIHHVGDILALFSRGCIWVCVMFGAGLWACGSVLALFCLLSMSCMLLFGAGAWVACMLSGSSMLLSWRGVADEYRIGVPIHPGGCLYG